MSMSSCQGCVVGGRGPRWLDNGINEKNPHEKLPFAIVNEKKKTKKK